MNDRTHGLAGQAGAAAETIGAASALRDAILRAIQDNPAGYALLTTDRAGLVTEWSTGARQMMGWTREEMLGQALGTIFTAEDRDGRVVQGAMRLAIRSGFAQRERWHLRRDGSRFWSTGALTPLRDPNRRLIGFLKIVLDHTAKREAAEALRVAAERHRLAAQATNDAIWDWNIGTDTVQWNEAVATAYGHDLPGGVSSGAWWSSHVHPEDRPRVGARLQAVVDGDGTNWSDEYRFRRSDGSEAYVLDRGVIVRDEAGRPLRMIGAMLDLSDRRAAQARLQASEDRLRLATEAGRLGTFDFIPDTRTLSANPRCHELFGVPQEPMVTDARVLLQALHPADRTRVRLILRRVLSPGGPHAFEFECRAVGGAAPALASDTDALDAGAAQDVVADQGASDQGTSGKGGSGNGAWGEAAAGASAVTRVGGPPDGWAATGVAEERWLAVNGLVCFDGSGVATRLIGTVLDITQRVRADTALRGMNDTLERRVEQRTAALRQAEEQLRQSQKMEAVGQLTGGLAHDFNNMLTGISGALEMMQTRLAQGRVDALPRYIAAAQGAASRAAKLTHRLLAFSRRQTLDPRPTAPDRMLQGMRELIERTAGPAITVEIAVDEASWLVLCDASQLENAMLNLCINARDAMPDGGRLLIECRNAVLEEDQPRDAPAGEYVALRVTDTGAGMSPEVMARAFDPFFTTKPIGQGTGLGLSMTYGFVKQSGGQVGLASEPGQGTAVELCLPRHRGPADLVRVDEPVVAEGATMPGGTVLIVDDEPMVRMLAAETLVGLGLVVIEAEDGRAGLQVLDSAVRVDLMVTDVGLPGGLNGRQLADAARVRRPDLPVLLITGYAEAAVMGEGVLEAGMRLMTKPFAMAALAERVQAMLGTPPH